MPEDTEVKRAAIESARRTVVVADSGKLERVFFAAVAPLFAVDTLVTDALSEGTRERVDLLEDAGLEVITTHPEHVDGARDPD